MSEYKFKTLEELQAAYPINSVFSVRREINKDIRYFYNKTDLRALERYNDDVDPISDCECVCTKTVINARIVNGYIYDGEYWYPAYNSYDGWVEYDESDIFKEEEVIFDSTKYRRK